MLFIANSGLRPNEARQLRWRDIKTTPDKHRYIYVRLTTKTGERDTFPLPHAFRYLDRVSEQSEYRGADDLVFGNREGKPVDNFGKTFKSILQDTNLLYDSEGKLLLHSNVHIHSISFNAKRASRWFFRRLCRRLWTPAFAGVTGRYMVIIVPKNSAPPSP